MAAELDRLGVRSIALHRGLYIRNPAVPSSGWFAARGLLTHGWSVQRTAGPVWLFQRGRIGFLPKRIEPVHTKPIFCQGWYANASAGRYMSETHAPFWIYGSGRLELQFAASSLRRRIALDGRPNLVARKRDWHLVTVDVPRLVDAAGQSKRVGLLLTRIGWSQDLAQASRPARLRP